ncbi:hypothetical protein BCV70DRAFT_203294 [Testicularia cyperi]|uniref:ER transporter 6TM N-terminal domain-containing protein n=1 Tax=Testicularia cyperi TaxID=1882483 RepID=A0A317XFH2_9BASI|nr:hypothetical protein BCV70DRAFT_203294 [Testicularia cyperi]
MPSSPSAPGSSEHATAPLDTSIHQHHNNNNNAEPPPVITVQQVSPTTDHPPLAAPLTGPSESPPRSRHASPLPSPAGSLRQRSNLAHQDQDHSSSSKNSISATPEQQRHTSFPHMARFATNPQTFPDPTPAATLRTPHHQQAPSSANNTTGADIADPEKGVSTTAQNSSGRSRDGSRPKKSATSSGARWKRHWSHFARLVGLEPLPWIIAWIPPCLTWAKLKPVIRSAIVAWICMLLLLISPVEIALGNASFLVLIGAFIQPAEVPLVAVIEREFFTLLFACASWTWAIIAIAISHSVRRNKLSPAQTSLARAINGDYIEARVSIVCAVFLAVGSAGLLYTKIRFGPSPFLFASVLSCILLNICLTYAPLYPYPFYSLGQSVVIPLAVKAAINVVVSCFFFPKSVNSQFAERLIAVLSPLAAAAGEQPKLLEISPLDSSVARTAHGTSTKPATGSDSGSSNRAAAKAKACNGSHQHDEEEDDEFDFEQVKNKLTAAEGGLMPLNMSSRLLTREISFGLASGEDLKSLERLTRALVAPADGWAYYYTSIKADISLAHFPKTPVPSRLATPVMTPAMTPRTSAEHSRDPSESSHPTTTAAARLHPVVTTGASESVAMPHRGSPLHGQVVSGETAASSAVSMRQLDEHPSVQPGNELASSRFRKITRSIASASRSSSPRRWAHHNSQLQQQQQHHPSQAHPHGHLHEHHDGHGHHGSSAGHSHRNYWDRHSNLFQNLVHRRDPAPVAIWESIRFGDLETYLHTTSANYITEMFAALLRETSSELLSANSAAITHVTSWLTKLNSERYSFLRDRLFQTREAQEEKGRTQADETAGIIADLETKLRDFRTRKRLQVLDPYRDALTSGGSGLDDDVEVDLRIGPGEIGKLHHRYLYQAWLHQFHTVSFTEKLLVLLREVEHIQRQRTIARLWFPSFTRIFSIEAWRSPGGADDEHQGQPDEEADHIPDLTNDAEEPSRQRSRSRSRSGSGKTDSSNETRRGTDEVVDPESQKKRPAHTMLHRQHSDLHHADQHMQNGQQQQQQQQHHLQNAQMAVDPIVDLGSTRARDPDALDPEGPLQILGQKLYFWTRRPFRGNLLFGVKAAVLIALVSLPAYMQDSAGWCYRNRAIWAIFMAQLTLARFRGETAFALLSRILATVIGAAVGLTIWYISTGDGYGNTYGLGATTAVAFPLIMLFRLYFPGPPITPIITTVTVALIVGYSWKDVKNPSPGSPGYGWSAAWRRFVAVVIGVSAAYIFSYLPPSSTLRQYQRLSHAATIAELGKVYCQVVSIASKPHHQLLVEQQSHAAAAAATSFADDDGGNVGGGGGGGGDGDGAFESSTIRNPHPSSEAVQKRLIAIRAKLRRLSMISVNVSYEFSLRGSWPAARYADLFRIQLEMSKLLSHCLTVLEKLGPAYSIALLRRTRFLDPRFLGDVVSVISMCATALKTAEPLPQITACPLLDRFIETPHGLNAYIPTTTTTHSNLQSQSQDDPACMMAAVAETWQDELLETLPKKITLSVLEDQEYMDFSVGVLTLFGLVLRIDRLCVAVKQLVGESFAVPADIHRTLVVRSANNPVSHSVSNTLGVH